MRRISLEGLTSASLSFLSFLVDSIILKGTVQRNGIHKGKHLLLRPKRSIFSLTGEAVGARKPATQKEIGISKEDRRLNSFFFLLLSFFFLSFSSLSFHYVVKRKKRDGKQKNKSSLFFFVSLFILFSFSYGEYRSLVAFGVGRALD